MQTACRATKAALNYISQKPPVQHWVVEHQERLNSWGWDAVSVHTHTHIHTHTHTHTHTYTHTHRDSRTYTHTQPEGIPITRRPNNSRMTGQRERERKREFVEEREERIGGVKEGA